jgi:hypothetical protein
VSRKRLNAWIAVGILVAGLVPWAIPSDVPRLIVMERDVLLGRYAVPWFCVLAFLITPGSWLAAWAVWSLRTRTHRAVAFRLIALFVALGVGLAVVEIGGRALRRQAYQRTEERALTEFPLDQRPGTVLHRVPDQRHEIRIADEPGAARSYPGRPAGHPPLDCTLSTDARGFRNPTALERCDVVAVGDSFAEGCLVSDEHPWPVVLGERTGLAVYNLGMSGADPVFYRSALRSVGFALKPRIALVMLYEDNDFFGVPRQASGDLSFGRRIRLWIETSPVVDGLMAASVALFGDVRADAPVPGFERISSWMPATVPAGPSGHHYAVKPKRVLRLAEPRAAFEASYGWTSTVEVLRDIRRLCDENGVRLVFVLAPSKARVLMSLIGDRVSAEELHAFVALRRRPLPPPEPFREAVLANLHARGEALRDLFQREGVPFVDLMPMLRQATADGHQVFFTYDQHWTPEGHRRAAERLAEVVSAMEAEGTSARPPR